MAKTNNKLISNNFEDSSHLIENEEEEEDKHEYKLLSSALLTRKCSLISSLKQSLCIQLSIVLVLFSLLVLFTIVKLTTNITTNTEQSFHKLIDSFSPNDDTNETDISDYIFLKTKLRHGSVRVITHCGTLFGGKEQEAFVFKGIPYAHPPIGIKRWSPPEPLCDPESHRHCNKFGSHCFQVNPFSRELEGKEDCLYLNVWTPTIDPEAKLSVMVWIHGGFLQFGSGHQPGLKPNGKLAKNTNTVYISLNYRLHALGFLPLDLLSNNTKKSTNFGLMDVILALQWIQLNIKSFGGDNKRVTLFGADSGAALIFGIITNAEMRSLFQSCWLIDPAVYFDKSILNASKDNKKNFLTRTNCKTIDCLRALSPKQVIKNFLGKSDPSFRIIDQNDLPVLGIMSEQLITIDGTIVRDSYPYKTLNSDIPILIGSSSQAIAFWPGPKDFKSWSWNDYRKYVTTSLDSFGPRLSQMSLELYSSTQIDSEHNSPQLKYITMVSELRQICPINYLSEVLALNADNKNIFRYIINARISKPVRVYELPVNYSFHLIDAISYFGQMEAWIRWPTFNDYSISETVQQIVLTFINGNNGSLLSQSLWQSFPRQYAEIVSQLNYTSIVTSNYHQSDRCYFWQSEQLFNYMWTV